MPGQSDGQGGKIPLKSFLDDFRADMSDQELRKKYNLDPRSFVKLIQVLLDRKVISESDLTDRRRKSVERDLKKESEFISGLYICSACSHPSSERFDICPACGTVQADVEKIDEEIGGKSMSTMVISREIDQYEEEEAEVELINGSSKPGGTAEPEIGSGKSGSGGSRLNSLRSFLSKKKNNK
jgi:hypothetical protein